MHGGTCDRPASAGLYEAARAANAEVGKDIRALRLAKGWTQKVLADRVRAEGQPMDCNRVSRLEAGKHDWDVPLLTAFARALGADVRVQIGT